MFFFQSLDKEFCGLSFPKKSEGKAFPVSKIQTTIDFKLLRTNNTEKAFPVYISKMKKRMTYRSARFDRFSLNFADLTR